MSGIPGAPVAPIRVLCIDIDSGRGGSSRSLYESVVHLDSRLVSVEIWCCNEGPMTSRYRAAGIPIRIIESLPRYKAGPRVSRNLVVALRAAIGLWKKRTFLNAMAEEIEKRFDLVHFNLDASIAVVRYLRERTSCAFITHMRGMVEDSIFARWQIHALSFCNDHLVFITKNELENFLELGGECPHTVIHNISAPNPAVVPDKRIPNDGRLKVGSLGYFHLNKGTDRLLELAKALDSLGRRDILFVVAGSMKLSAPLSPELETVAKNGGDFETYVSACGFADMFLFLGYIDNPEFLLSGCDLLAKPHRENRPWGRDILEAMALGVPVITAGDDQTFVENEITGIIHSEFDAKRYAMDVIRLADDKLWRSKLSSAAKLRVEHLCNGRDRAMDLLNVWQNASAAGRVPPKP